MRSKVSINDLAPSVSETSQPENRGCGSLNSLKGLILHKLLNVAEKSLNPGDRSRN